MSSPRSCRRCPNLLALETPSGLCPECAAPADTGADTAGPTSRTPSDPVPAARPGSDAPTASFIPAADVAEPVVLHPPTGTDPLGHEGIVSGASFGVVGDARGARTTVLPLPTSPPGYDLLGALGGGGMGDVYLAREQASERLVAMKFLRNPGNPELLERFTLELRVLAKLDHPNIVRVLASDFRRADPFFTMEYLEPGSLTRVLQERGPFAPERAVPIARAVAGALSAAHAQNIVHRDVKPSNILLTADGTPKLADLGLAKRLDEADPVTLHSGGLGTPSYMPPEQISRKNGALGPWSDVYGLGATLYHLLTGHAPFLGESVQEIIPRVLNEPPRRPRARNPEIPMALEAIVLKCLEKNPKDRYQSMAELVADLDRYEQKRHTVAPLETWVRRVKRWPRRNRRGIAVAVLAVLVVAGAFVLGAANVPKPPDAPVPPDPLEELERELATGDVVTLIGETGKPRWYRWALGEGRLGESERMDGTYCIESHALAFLELLADPGRDSYRLTAHIRHLHANPRGGFVGAYVGATRVAEPDGIVVYPAVMAEFSEYLSMHEIDLPMARADHGVSLQTAAGWVRPGQPGALGAPSGSAQLRFVPHEEEPRPWRVVRFDVTPERVRLFWACAGEPDALVGEISATKIASEREQARDWLAQVARRPVPCPEWAPRRALGIWLNDSVLSVKNVTIQPLPRTNGEPKP